MRQAPMTKDGWVWAPNCKKLPPNFHMKDENPYWAVLKLHVADQRHLPRDWICLKPIPAMQLLWNIPIFSALLHIILISFKSLVWLVKLTFETLRWDSRSMMSLWQKYSLAKHRPSNKLSRDTRVVDSGSICILVCCKSLLMFNWMYQNILHSRPFHIHALSKI